MINQFIQYQMITINFNELMIKLQLCYFSVPFLAGLISYNIY